MKQISFGGIFAHKVKKLRTHRRAAMAEVVCLPQHRWSIWEWAIRTPPRIPVYVASHPQEEQSVLSDFYHFLFACDVLFMILLSLVSQFTSFIQICVPTVLVRCLKGKHCFHLKKSCSGVMQMFWFTSTGGHKLLYLVCQGGYLRLTCNS